MFTAKNDEIAGAFRWTTPRDAKAIQQETDFIEAMNRWDHKQRWRRTAVAARNFALLSLIPASAFVAVALYRMAHQ